MIKCNSLSNLYGDKIDFIISEYIDILSNTKKIKKILENQSPDKNILDISSILLVLSKANNYCLKFDLEKTIHIYMMLLNKNLNNVLYMPPSLYGGLSTIGFAIYMISEIYPYYKNTLNKLNKLIVNDTYIFLDNIKNQDNVKVSDYDLISGLSGISMYLLNFNDDYIKDCIIQINKYLVSIFNKKEINSIEVPSIHISSNSQILDKDKEFYKNGNFNFSLSHGMCGPLVALSLSYKEDIIVENQKETINYILNMFDYFKIEKEDSLYWNGILSFEEFTNFDKNIYKSKQRDSWCYGVPGIARSLYLSSKILDNSRVKEISTKAFKCLYNGSTPNNWKLNSPTICHGFSGMIIISNLMLLDENDDTYFDLLKLAVEKTIDFYNSKYIYLFKNIENIENGTIYQDNLNFLTGSSGIILSLLFVRDKKVKPIFRLLGLH